jgi:hypothetical protein
MTALTYLVNTRTLSEGVAKFKVVSWMLDCSMLDDTYIRGIVRGGIAIAHRGK